VKWIVSMLVLLLGRGRRKPPPEPKPPPDRDAETLVLWLLVLVGLFSVAFAAFYVHDGDTQLLGLAIGLAFLCAAAASVLAALRLVPQDEHVEARPELDDQEKAGEAIETYSEGSVRLTRKRLLLTATVGAGGALAGALVFPALSLGPNAVEVLSESPWREGRRVVDDEGRPVRAGDVAVGSFRTAFPEHASKELLSSPIVVVRIREDELELPDDRRDWAPSGILAFSKICPHAGCAISLFRYPSFEDTQPYPALICPCHYSTFKVADGGSRTFGPAARALPQLPLRIDGDGALVAGGDFSENIGPSWWKVRKDTHA
jgi:ubiquinol-cytochrome c reductase iron-sulfur subunit